MLFLGTFVPQYPLQRHINDGGQSKQVGSKRFAWNRSFKKSKAKRVLKQIKVYFEPNTVYYNLVTKTT